MQIKNKLFRYEVYSERHEDIGSSLEAMWSEAPDGQTDEQMSRKLSDLSASLKQWSSATIGSVGKEIKKIEKRAGHFQE